VGRQIVETGAPCARAAIDVQSSLTEIPLRRSGQGATAQSHPAVREGMAGLQQAHEAELERRQAAVQAIGQALAAFNRLCSNQRLLRPPNAPIDISNSSARGLAAAHLNHLGFKIDRVYMLEAACEVQCHASRPAGQVKKNSRRR
jgi:hypothetical protein